VFQEELWNLEVDLVLAFRWGDLPEITLQPANQWKINDFLHDLPI